MANQRQEGRRSPVLMALVRPLDAKVRNTVVRRYDNMIRELDFLSKSGHKDLTFIRTREWSREKLSAVFGLNCIYQEVLGPLAASARPNSVTFEGDSQIKGIGIGTSHPISHGSQRFDNAHNVQVPEMMRDFYSLINDLNLERRWMTLNTCGDIVYWIARRERDEDKFDQVWDE